MLRCGFYNQEHGALKADGSRAPATGRSKVQIVDISDTPLKRITGTVGWDCEFHEKSIEAWITGAVFSHSACHPGQSRAALDLRAAPDADISR